MKVALKPLSKPGQDRLIMVILAAMAYYALFFTRAIQQTGDSLGYALAIKTGQDLYHPHHLLYNPLVRPFYLILSSINDACDAILAAQLHNILWAILAVVAAYIVINHLYQSRRAGILAGLCLLLTHGFWRYTTQVEVYVPATACLIVLASHIMTQDGRSLKRADQMYMAIILAMAIFFHQTNVLFCIPLAYYLIAEYGKKGFKIWIHILLICSVFVFAVYVLAFSISAGQWDYKWFIRFLFSYTQFRNPEWGLFSHFGIQGIRQLLASQTSNITIWPGAFITTLAGMCIVIWHLFQIRRKKRYYKIRLFLLLWIVTYYVFFLWWLPSEKEFFITTLVPIIFLVFIFLFDFISIRFWSEKTGRNAVVLILMVLFAFFTFVNIQDVFQYHRSIGRDYDEASRLAFITPNECMVLSTFSVHQHLRYYFELENVLILPHQYFYFQQPLSDKHQKYQSACFTVSMAYLLPEYSFSEMNGYTHPSQWLNWLSWLFKFQYDERGNLVACREFDTLTSKEGFSYLLIKSSYMPIQGFKDLFHIFDETIAPLQLEGENPFSLWLQTYDKR